MSNSRTRFLTMTVEEIDSNGGGQFDEEMVVIADENKRVIESKEGQPDGSPFRTRQRIYYDEAGKLTKRITFKDNSSSPSSVDIFTYT